ncbi:MAG: hypothetical protein M1820_003907 [Bogoriella megaspora]|nr:MAG: hypothetical protein M1820_003907 [Bogoriella megaspora]
MPQKSKENRKSLPKNWPPNVTYLTDLSYTAKLDRSVLRISRSLLPAESAILTLPRLTLPSPLVRITPITNSQHPAYPQFGLFAARNLPAGSFILLYLGFAHTDAESDFTSDYDLSLDRESGVGVDASKAGNEARFMNDYRGIKEAPNAEFKDAWIEESIKGNGGDVMMSNRIGVFVLNAGKSGKRAKGIAKGEEIVVSYGKGFWRERQSEYGKEDVAEH